MKKHKLFSKNQSGFSLHYILPILVIAMVAVVGVRLSSIIHAASYKLPTGYAGSARGGNSEPARQLIENNKTKPGSLQFTSRNWDGYMTIPKKGDSFYSVKATWIQPTVRCEADKAWTVFWVGLDGWFNNNVEQGGSEAFCNTAGSDPYYALWWEMYPTNSIQTMISIQAGDQITASVVYDKSNSTFTISVKDNTSKQSFTVDEQCTAGQTCPRNSANVITEAVGNYGGSSFFPLADYGTMGYTNISFQNSTKNTGTIIGSRWSNAAITEYSDGHTYATVSSLSSDGSAFKTTWKSQ